MALKTEEKAPDFTLKNQKGETITLSDFKGQWVLIYFYPKDDTPGCTKEACSLRDEFGAFGKLDAVVLGISTDTALSHKKFAEKYKLPFNLLSDTEKKVVEAYGVWGEKSMYGKNYRGTIRSSFLIDPDGVIVKIYPKVKPETHAGEVLADLRELQKLS